jgi:hypothetical protein
MQGPKFAQWSNAGHGTYLIKCYLIEEGRGVGGGLQKTDLLLCVENWCAIDEFAI